MSKTKTGRETPLMKQYNLIRAKYPGALLLFRVGDFYETFGEDAITASKILDIVLTRRANGAASHIELAGFPHHALDTYLPKLVRAGYRVAICDQLEDPKMVKGIVKRGVTELVTPGLSFHDNVLEKRQNNFLASVHFGEKNLGISFLDLSTGEFLTSSGNAEYASKLLQSLNPSEIIFSKANKGNLKEIFGDKYNYYHLEDWVFQYDYTYEKLTNHFKTTTLKGFGIESFPESIISAGAVLYYLEETEHNEISHISSVSRIEEEKYVWLDKFTIRNLELVYPQQEGGIPLIQVLDNTVTPMGSRLLKKWIVLPLKEKDLIEERLRIVESLINEETGSEEILKNLRQISDIERLVGKVSAGRINPRELLQLKRALKHTLPIKEILKRSANKDLQKLGELINPCDFVIQKIESELSDDPPMLLHLGKVMKKGVNAELDELREIAYSGKEVLVQIQQREIKQTGISSLKVAYNKVFGYYLEVTNVHKDKVPSNWIRKQTLVNAERYITEELKVYEDKILTAEEKITSIEQKLYFDLVRQVSDFIVQIQENARILAKLDCLLSFAETATKSKYCKPEIDDSLELEIIDGRHAVIEKQLPTGEEYVPNNLYLDNHSDQILIITGPNMAGKSALLRQTALIVLMAQMGSFVPASTARIGLIDKVFTRVGASDNLSRGESTFMVEMIETASILNNISERSLILMDEIGRGTSTYDGVSIAWSIVEYLHKITTRPKTLFATHYHELNQLSEDLPRIKNFNVSVKEVGDRIIFLRKLKPGGSEHSFGIHVAQMAGMPNSIVLRADEILHFLEKDKKKSQEKKMREVPRDDFQLMLFDNDPKIKQVKEMLDALDINTMSPVEALLKLNEFKGLLGK
ncbi:MAG TPA: DNA mismatch repair protein MutS [Cyclobacteriaceae bacterium]